MVEVEKTNHIVGDGVAATVEGQKQGENGLGQMELLEPSMDAAISAEIEAVLAGDQPPSKKWKDLSTVDRCIRVGKIFLKICGLFVLLYFFICSLDFLATSFRLIGGRATGQIFRNSELLSNPVVGLMIGVLVTVLVQSSSTSTSIVVSMVAANFIDVHVAIPIIMGANVGTSVTNTLVSLSHIADRQNFGAAFAGATVHDAFNWLCVIVLLPFEVATGYLETTTEHVVDLFPLETDKSKQLSLLSALTKPFTKTIIQLNKTVLTGWSHNDPNFENATLMRLCDPAATKPCEGYLLQGLSSGLSDSGIGLLLLVLSLALLCSCLVAIVKLLNSMLKGQMAHLVQRTLNAKLPYVPWLTGYLALLAGCAFTVLLQSSSVFTSALTPLVGMGLLSVERVYPLTLGSNIGTTTTALLASLAADSSRLRYSIQIALCHLFFNITGILIFYPIPFMRWPVPLAKALGRVTARYRWFALTYLLFAFFLIPLAVFLLSLADMIAVYVVLIPIMIILGLVVIVNLIQKRKPDWLPKKYQTWDWLPLWMRSLEPLDKIISKLACCRKKKKTTKTSDEKKAEGETNPGFQNDP